MFVCRVGHHSITSASDKSGQVTRSNADGLKPDALCAFHVETVVSDGTPIAGPTPRGSTIVRASGAGPPQFSHAHEPSFGLHAHGPLLKLEMSHLGAPIGSDRIVYHRIDLARMCMTMTMTRSTAWRMDIQDATAPASRQRAKPAARGIVCIVMTTRRVLSVPCSRPHLVAALTTSLASASIEAQTTMYVSCVLIINAL